MAELSNPADFPADDAVGGTELIPAYDPSKPEGSRRVHFTPAQVLAYVLAHADTTEKVQDVLNATLVAGANVTLTYDDVANTLTIAATGGATYTDEQVRDVVAAFLTAGTNITLTHNDAGDTLTIDAASGSTSVDGLEGSGSILRWVMGNGSGGTFTQNGLQMANQGSTSAPSLATTNRLTRLPRHTRSTGASAGASAGLNTAQHLWREVGFTYEFRGGIETIVAGVRLFIGVRGSTGLNLNVDPSGWQQIVGFALDAADTNIQLMHNDGAGAATKVDTGIAKAAGDELYVRIHCTAGGNYEVTLKQFAGANLTTTPTATYGPVTVSTDMPDATQACIAGHAIGNGGTAAAALISMLRESLRSPI